MNDFIQKIKNYTDVVIFGYSAFGKTIYEQIEYLSEEKNICFCDNSKIKLGLHGDVDILSVESAAEKYPDGLFIIASTYHVESMKDQLMDLNILENNIISQLPNKIHYLKENRDRIVRTTPRKKIQFEVNLADHCNLNCKCCNHFSTLAQAGFADYDTFSRDFKRLSELFDGVSDRIYLLGGEPLLTPNLDKYLIVARESFTESEIGIITNGLLLKFMDDKFWSTCRDYKIKIIPTKYPINLDYDEMQAIAKRNKVQYEYFSNTDDYKYVYHYPLDLEGNQDFQKSFYNCIHSNDCISLKNGKLYTCPIIPHVEHFNNYFNKKVNVNSKDYIDIYAAKNGQEILEFLSKPVKFCRYCNVSQRTYDHKWGTSKKNIKEWTL